MKHLGKALWTQNLRSIKVTWARGSGGQMSAAAEGARTSAVLSSTNATKTLLTPRMVRLIRLMTATSSSSVPVWGFKDRSRNENRNGRAGQVGRKGHGTSWPEPEFIGLVSIILRAVQLDDDRNAHLHKRRSNLVQHGLGREKVTVHSVRLLQLGVDHLRALAFQTCFCCPTDALQAI